MQMYCVMESLLTQSAEGNFDTLASNLEQFSKMYTDFDMHRLDVHLKMLPDLCKTMTHPKTAASILSHFQQLAPEVRNLVSEVEKLVQLLLVIPASSATAERSFSAHRRLKSYIRSTMGQDRLNYVAILHIHRKCTDKLDLEKLLREFVQRNDFRRQVFGQGTCN
jgi:hypothetical protein